MKAAGARQGTQPVQSSRPSHRNLTALCGAPYVGDGGNQEHPSRGHDGGKPNSLSVRIRCKNRPQALRVRKGSDDESELADESDLARLDACWSYSRPCEQRVCVQRELNAPPGGLPSHSNRLFSQHDAHEPSTPRCCARLGRWIATRQSHPSRRDVTWGGKPSCPPGARGADRSKVVRAADGTVEGGCKRAKGYKALTRFLGLTNLSLEWCLWVSQNQSGEYERKDHC